MYMISAGTQYMECCRCSPVFRGVQGTRSSIPASSNMANPSTRTVPSNLSITCSLMTGRRERGKGERGRGRGGEGEGKGERGKGEGEGREREGEGGEREEIKREGRRREAE